MKFFVVCVFVIGAVVAEPPRFRGRFQPQFQRQEVAPLPQDQEETTPLAETPYPPAPAPYPPSGCQPAGRAFNLPAKQQQAPPTNKYGPPATATSDPEETTTEAADDIATTANPDSENIKLNSQSQKLQEPLQNQGAYYVLLPDSRLQKIQYRTENDVRNMAYTARLQYKDVEPVNGPIYVVSPQYFLP